MAGATTHATVCFTCDIVDQYVNLANEYTQSLSHILLVPMSVIFFSLVGVWVVIQGFRMTLLQTTVAEFGKELIYVIIATFLLSRQGPELVNTIYADSLKIMGSAASIALQVGDHIGAANPEPTAIGGGMHALVQFAEKGVRQVFGMAQMISAKATALNWMPVIYALVLVVPYFLVLIVYFSQVVIAIFRIMMLAALSPYLMLGFAFNWGRGMAIAGIRTLLSSFMILFGATIALSVMLYAISKLHIGDVGYSADNLSIVTDKRYLLALAMGWMGTAFMTEATGIANSISGSVLSNTGVAVITAGLSASALALSAAPKAFALWGGKGMVGAVDSGTSKIAQGAGYGLGATASHAQRVADLVRRAKKE